MARARALQRGLSLLGALIVIAAAVAALYYVYEGTFFEPEDPSCDQLLTRCLAKCRRTSTEASQSKACQEGCARENSACEPKS
jgi:hypothetical protein